MSTINEAKESVHLWFGLSYASYFVMPRSVLQSMPEEWQEDFIEMIKEIPQTLDIEDMPNYRVNAVNENGKFIKDEFASYERGRRRFPIKK